MTLGAKVTLRGDGMFNLNQLVTIALPRVKDFRGLNPKASIIISKRLRSEGAPRVPEINYDEVDNVLGMDVIVVTTAKTDDEVRELSRGFNFLSAAKRTSGARNWPEGLWRT